MKKLVKEICSPSNEHKVLILRKLNGQYIVEAHNLYTFETTSSWENSSSGLHIFDSYTPAEEAAKELLRNVSGETIKM